MRSFHVFAIAVLAAACSSDSVDSNEQARRAYLGLDGSISKSLELAFTGYDAASSANIPDETGSGDAGGTIVVSGKVDQGNPAQASMSLAVALADYSDGAVAIDTHGDTITVGYSTGSDATTQPALGIKLNQSSGSSLDGTLTGDYTMTGDLGGSVSLDITLSGTFTGSGTSIARVPGSTTVTGTATNSDGGVFDVNVML